MFLQTLTLRLVVIVAMLMTGATGLVYTAAPMSDSPLFMAYVDQFTSSENRLFAYLVDPERRYTVSIDLPVPRSLVTTFGGPLAGEPNTLYLNYSVTDAFTRTTIGRVYRYNFSTKALTTVYETIHGAYLPGFSRRILDFKVFEDEQHYIIADKIQHAIVLVNRNTLEQRTLWQGDSITGRTTNYSLQAIPSPTRDKFAILDDSQEPILTVVSREGEVLNEFHVIDLPFTQLTWLADNQHVLVTAPRRRLASDIRVYDTVSGQSTSFTDSMRGSYIQPLYSCNVQDKWISYVKRMKDDVYHLFTTNMATGATFEQTSFASGTDPFEASIISNQDCSILLQAVPAEDSGTNDIYQTTLKGENIQFLLSDVIAGPFINESSFVYGQPNDSGGYDLYKMSLNDGITTEMLLSNLPTHEAVWAKDIHERGWYILRKNTWDRTQTQFAAISGDPLVYYDAHSGETHVLTPPDVRIMLFSEVP